MYRDFIREAVRAKVKRQTYEDYMVMNRVIQYDLDIKPESLRVRQTLSRAEKAYGENQLIQYLDAEAVEQLTQTIISGLTREELMLRGVDKLRGKGSDV